MLAGSISIAGLRCQNAAYNCGLQLRPIKVAGRGGSASASMRYYGGPRRPWPGWGTSQILLPEANIGPQHPRLPNWKCGWLALDGDCQATLRQSWHVINQDMKPVKFAFFNVQGILPGYSHLGCCKYMPGHGLRDNAVRLILSARLTRIPRVPPLSRVPDPIIMQPNIYIHSTGINLPAGFQHRRRSCSG